jgi:hypothetical protein
MDLMLFKAGRRAIIGGTTMKPTLKPAMVHLKSRMSGDVLVLMGMLNVFNLGFHFLIPSFLIFFQGKQVIGSGRDTLVDSCILTAHGAYCYDTSFITDSRIRTIISNNLGIAVISVLFSSLFTGANTNRFSLAQTLTKLDGFMLLPTIKAPPDGFPVYSDNFPLYLPHPFHEA